MALRLITRPATSRSRADEADPELDSFSLDDEAELRDTFGDSALWLRDHVPVALAVAGVTHTVVNELPWDKFAERLAGVAAPLAQTAERSAGDAVSSLGVTGPRVPGDTRTGGAWDSSFPLARRAASERAAELVTQVTDEQRQRVADVIQRALAEGWDVPRTARELRSGIGLTDAWAGAVSNMHAGNLASGMDPARAGKLADQYYERLLTSRSTTIARTELLGASNQGRLAGWQQAANAGVFDSNTATKRWIVGDSSCDICDGLDGEETEWDGTFSSGDDMPPAHPNCRCTAVIENVEQSGGGEQPAETLGPSEEDVADEPVAAMLKYSDDQPRDEHGRFGSGGGEIRSVANPEHADDQARWTTSGSGAGLHEELIHGKANDQFALREASHAITEQRSAWLDQLSPGEMSAIRGYRDYSININSALRGLPGTDSAPYKDQAERIDRAISSSPSTDRDATVFRAGRLPSGLEPGQEFKDYGFVSTSLAQSDAKAFGSPMEIRVPAGTKMGWVDGVLNRTGGGLPEREMLLPRGTTFRYLGEQKIVNGAGEELYGKRTVLEVVPA